VVLGASGRGQIGLIDVRKEGKKERVKKLAMRLTDMLDNDAHTYRFTGTVPTGSARQVIWHVYDRYRVHRRSQIE